MVEHSAEDVRARWNENAEAYAEKCSRYGDRNKEVLLTPTILDLLGEVKGKAILDAGCGEGYLSRLMAERGAAVVAIDYSEKLLDLAGERTPHDLQIEYRHANFERLDLFGAESFDLVVSVAALNDIADYESAVREAYRVLIRGGAFLLALLHPCFSADGRWVRDAEGRKLHWKVDNYFREIPSEQRLTRHAARQPLYFHRTLTSYFRTLLGAGFQIETLVEPHPSQAALEKFPEYADDLRMSHFLVLVLRKCPCP